MKKETARIFAFIILGLFMFSFLAGVVSAQEDDLPATEQENALRREVSPGGPEIGLDIGDWANKIKVYFETVEKTEGGVKFIFWVLITLFFIMLSMFAVKKPIYLILIIPISALLSYLLIIYITPEEVWGILQSYTALGLALITIFPLVILIGMTYVAAVTGSGFLRVIQLIGWITYMIYLIYKIFLRLIDKKLHITLIIALVVSIIAIIFNGIIYSRIRKQSILKEGEESQITMTEAALAAKSLRKFRKETAEAS